MSTLAGRFHDFPDWLGPMLVKELRQGLKTRAFVLSFTALQAIFVVVLIYHALLYSKNGEGFEAGGLNAVFWVIVGAQLIFITPLRAFNDLAAERKANTLELIFMTGLTPWRIAVGKWASLLFQAMLFVLAVLPYGILRYFFGGVNLTEELAMLACMLLACGVLSAIAIAISGLPVFARIGAAILAIFLGTGVIPGFFMMARFGGRSSGVSEMPWQLLLYDALLVILGALAMGATTIAPPAENHALRQRLIAFLAGLALPVLYVVHADTGVQFAQTVGFAVIVMLTGLLHLAVTPVLMRRYFEPFARFKRAGFTLALPLLPGAASAGVFQLISVTLLLAVGRMVLTESPDFRKFASIILMASAAMLMAPTLWRIIRRRSKWVVVEQILFLVIVGSISAFLLSLKTDGTHFFPSAWAGMVPPIGFWLMFDRSDTMQDWMEVALCGFIGYSVLLQVSYRRYWCEAWELFKTVCKEAQPAKAKAAEVAAKPVAE
jgi:hypothetical protein